MRALELAERLRRREVTSVELTEQAITAIRARDGELGAFVEVAARRAMLQAKRADALLKRDGPHAPFLGVPTAIKDHEPVRGLGTRLGSRAFRWVISPIDGYVARACRRAGFILLGKTACSELTILPYAHGTLHPPTRNPHDPTRYSGGSSAGAAAAVAADMISIAPGSDGGGSIRIPAAFCGLVGVKPSRGALPNPAGMFDPVGLSTIGPLARSVRDAAAMLDILAERPSGAFARACDAPVPRLRVRVLVEPPLANVTTAPAHAAAVRDAARILEQLGHTVTEAPRFTGELDRFLPLMARMVARVPLLPIMERSLEPTTRWLRARGRGVTLSDVRAIADSLARDVDAAFGDADVMVTPTTAQPPPRVGAFADLDGEQTFRTAAALGAFTAPFNVSGQPAISLPWRSQGLPIGVQIIARRGADHLLLAVATELERQIGNAARAS
jgi:amidase